MMRIFLLAILLTTKAYCAFFQNNQEQFYHLSIGAVLFNEEGKIACHHFSEILGQKDIYILMRESMENDETIFTTLERGLKEEFGATAQPIAFLGCLSGFINQPPIHKFEKTTLYVACKVVDWDPTKRDPHDAEAASTIEWLDPDTLINIMENQGRRYKRVDADESEMIKRALPYILGARLN